MANKIRIRGTDVPKGAEVILLSPQPRPMKLIGTRRGMVVLAYIRAPGHVTVFDRYIRLNGESFDDFPEPLERFHKRKEHTNEKQAAHGRNGNRACA